VLSNGGEVLPTMSCDPQDPFPDIPRELKELVQWVAWRLEPHPKDPNKLTKIPYSPKGFKASTTSPTSWGTYKEAIFSYLDPINNYSGIGFIFTVKDDYIGIDYDGVIENGELRKDILEEVRFIDSYTEISQSGKGLHIIGRGKKPGRFGELREVYDKGRYFAITGKVLDGYQKEIKDVQGKIDKIYEDLIGEAPKIITQIPRVRNDTQSISDKYRLTVEEVGYPINALDRGGGQMQGEHPVHGSKTGMNFSINTHDNVWHCFRCESGGGAIELFAVREGIINCADAGPGCLNGKWGEIFKALQRCGYKDHSIVEYKPPDQTPPPDHDEITCDTICSSYELSELGNSKRFIERYGENLRYCHIYKSWYHWNGKYWREDDIGYVTELAKQTVLKIIDESKKVIEEKRERYLAHAGRSQKNASINSIIALSMSSLPVRPPDLDSRLDILNFPNGTLELNPLYFREHVKAELCTRTIICDYDKDAICPDWEDQLKIVFNDDEAIIETFQVACGYSLLGTHSEYFFICHGGGKNGKSVILQTLVKLINDYAGNIPPETLYSLKNSIAGNAAREDVVSMVGKRFIFASEPDKHVQLNINLIKALTGGENISARKNYGHQFTFYPQMSLWVATNHKPVITETGDAVSGRIRMFPFEVHVPTRLKELNREPKNQKDVVEAFIKKEGPGIINWLIRGLQKYHSLGYIPFCEKVTTATEQMLLENDALGRCIRDLTMKDHRGWINKDSWFIDVNKWCLDNDETPYQSKKELSTVMGERGFGKEERKVGERVWLGIRYKTNEEKTNGITQL
jgi:putative DNA primase/helicase